MKCLRMKGDRGSKGERVHTENEDDAISGGFVLIPPILVVGDVCGELLLCDRVWEPSCTDNSSVQGIEENPMPRRHQGLQRRRLLVPDQNVETVTVVNERVRPDR